MSNFMSKNSRFLSEIINTLQLSEYSQYIKPGFDINENGCEFPVKSKEFLSYWISLRSLTKASKNAEIEKQVKERIKKLGY